MTRSILPNAGVAGPHALRKPFYPGTDMNHVFRTATVLLLLSLSAASALGDPNPGAATTQAASSPAGAEIQLYPFPADRSGGKIPLDPRWPEGRPAGYPRYRGLYGAIHDRWMEYDFVAPREGDYRMAVAISGAYAQDKQINSFGVMIDGESAGAAFEKAKAPPLYSARKGAIEWIRDKSGVIGEKYNWTILADGATMHLTAGKHTLRLSPDIYSWGDFLKIRLTTEPIANAPEDLMPLWAVVKAKAAAMTLAADGQSIEYAIAVTNEAGFPQEVQVTRPDNKAQEVVRMAGGQTTTLTYSLPLEKAWTAAVFTAGPLVPGGEPQDMWAKDIAKLPKDKQDEINKLLADYRRATDSWRIASVQVTGDAIATSERRMTELADKIKAFAAENKLPAWSPKVVASATTLKLSLPPAGTKELTVQPAAPVAPAAPGLEAALQAARARAAEWLADPKAAAEKYAPQRPVEIDAYGKAICTLHEEDVELELLEKDTAGWARCPKCGRYYGWLDFATLKAAVAGHHLNGAAPDLLLLARTGDAAAMQALVEICGKSIQHVDMPMRTLIAAQVWPRLSAEQRQALLLGALNGDLAGLCAAPAATEMAAVLLRAEVSRPRYRNAIFATRKDLTTVEITAGPTPLGRLAGARVKVDLLSGKDGKILKSQTMPCAGEDLKFELPVAIVPEGRNTVEVSLLAAESDQPLAKVLLPLRKYPLAPEGTTEVWFDEKNVAYISGQPYFPMGFYGVGDKFEDIANTCPNGFRVTISQHKWYKPNWQKAWNAGGGLWNMMVDPPMTDAKFDFGAWAREAEHLKGWNSLFSWFLADEPDMRLAITPEITQRLADNYEKFVEWDPYHPTHINGFYPNRYKYWYQFCDAYGSDSYPAFMTKYALPPRDLFQEGAIPGLDNWSLFRAAAHPDDWLPDLGYVAQYMTALRKASEMKKPIWHTLGTCANGPVYPNYKELRAQSYLSVCLGARGLMWWGYWSGNIAGYIPHHPEMIESIKTLGREMEALTPMLVAPDSPVQPTVSVLNHEPIGRPIIYTLARDAQEGKYLLAVNMLNQDVRFRLAGTGLPAGTVLKVYKEDRTVTVGEGGVIEDRAEPLASHVYTTDATLRPAASLSQEQSYIDAQFAAKEGGNLLHRNTGARILTNLIPQSDAWGWQDGDRQIVGAQLSAAKPGDALMYKDSISVPHADEPQTYVRMTLAGAADVDRIVIFGAGNNIEKDYRLQARPIDASGKEGPWQDVPAKLDRQPKCGANTNVLTYRFEAIKARSLQLISDTRGNFAAKEITVWQAGKGEGAERK